MSDFTPGLKMAAGDHYLRWTTSLKSLPAYDEHEFDVVINVPRHNPLEAFEKAAAITALVGARHETLTIYDVTLLHEDVVCIRGLPRRVVRCENLTDAIAVKMLLHG